MFNGFPESKIQRLIHFLACIRELYPNNNNNNRSRGFLSCFVV